MLKYKKEHGGVDPFGPSGQPHFEIDFVPLLADAFQWHYPVPPEGSTLYDISITRIELRKNSKHILRPALISQSPPPHGADLGRKLQMDAVDRAEKALVDRGDLTRSGKTRNLERQKTQGGVQNYQGPKRAFYTKITAR
ncbi:hypothetical protein MPDQ_002910 [Monascus purpureus]|uniref:Uncharacterized protein n=1 Tax=Monascus purpureus TaxID=5098 RepID=A0A507QJP2_MONPU|nr:hypothetical protein MPDQ_002910 [Monascus purpureus]